MASIPLPALQVQPTPSPLDAYGRVMQMKSLMGQQQLQQSELANQDLARQQQQNSLTLQQIQLNDIQGWHKAFADANGDPEKMFDLAPKYGVSVPSFLKMRQTVNEMRNSYAQMDKNVLEDSQAHHKDLAGKLQAVIDAPPDQQQDAWTKGIEDARASGDLTPDVIAQLPAQFPGVDKATQFMHGLMMQGDIVSQALAEKKSAVTLPGEQAESLVKGLAAVGQVLGSAKSQQAWTAGRESLKAHGVSDDVLNLVPTTWSTQAQADAQRIAMSPEQAISSAALQSRYVNILTSMARGQTVTPDDRAFVSSFEKLKTLLPEAQMAMMLRAMQGNVPGAGNAPAPAAAPGAAPAPPKVFPFGNNAVTGPEFLNTIGNAALRAQVSQIVRGDAPLTSIGGFASRSAPLQVLQHMVYQADPNFSPLRYELTQQYVKDNKGKIDAMNTALGHAQAFFDASKGLNTGNVNLINGAANALGVEIGQTPVITYETILHRLGPELVKAYTGAQPTDTEIKKFEDDFSPSHSAQQRTAAIQTTVDLLRSKFNSYENQWSQVFDGKPPYTFEDRWLTPQAKQAVQTITGRSAAGGAAPNFVRTAVGANGHKIGQLANGTWVDAGTGKPIQ